MLANIISGIILVKSFMNYDACFVVFFAVACLLVYCCYAESTGSATVAYELAFFFFYFIDLHFVCKINSYYV